MPNKVGSKKAKVENIDGAARTEQCAVVEPIYTRVFLARRDQIRGI